MGSVPMGGLAVGVGVGVGLVPKGVAAEPGAPVAPKGLAVLVGRPGLAPVSESTEGSQTNSYCR